MKNKYIYAFLCVVTISLTLQSCKKYLDINKSPNSAEVVDPKLLFSFATTEYAIGRAGGDVFIPLAMAGQTMADGGFNTSSWSGGVLTEQEYVLSPYSYEDPWIVYYRNVGNNLKLAIGFAEAQKNYNAAAQCKVLLALSYYELTTLYGDVPYTESLNPNIRYPHFDTQQTVLKGVVTLLDEAIAEFNEDADPTTKISGTYDMFYGKKNATDDDNTSIAYWKRVAGSIKLRTLMTMVDADGSQAAAIGALITENSTGANAGKVLISSADDNFQIPFGTATGQQNPKYALQAAYQPDASFFFASKYVTDVMIPTTANTASDPRLPKFFTAAKNGKYDGIRPGATGNDDINPRISLNLERADEPETVFSYQEELFFEAEIYTRGLGVGANPAKANQLYLKAVRESCIFYGADATAIDVFFNGKPAVPAVPATPTEPEKPETAAVLPGIKPLTANTALHDINYQHWIDEMERGLDAFTQWRRSGKVGSEVPALTLPIGAPGDGLFRRYEYPQTSELLTNPNAPQTIKYYTKMWFDL